MLWNLLTTWQASWILNITLAQLDADMWRGWRWPVVLFPIFCLYPCRYLLRCGCCSPSGDARLPAVLTNPLIYSLNLSLIQSSTQSLFHPPTHSLVISRTHQRPHSSSHAPTNALTCHSTHPPTHSTVIPRTHQRTQPSFHAPTNALNRHSTHSPTHSPVIAPTHPHPHTPSHPHLSTVSSTNPRIHPLSYSRTDDTNPPNRRPTDEPIYPPINPPTHQPIHQPTHDQLEQQHMLPRRRYGKNITSKPGVRMPICIVCVCAICLWTCVFPWLFTTSHFHTVT
jgi:hypothetical protein